MKKDEVRRFAMDRMQLDMEKKKFYMSDSHYSYGRDEKGRYTLTKKTFGMDDGTVMRFRTYDKMVRYLECMEGEGYYSRLLSEYYRIHS